jgi:hypothetical protein
MPKIRNKNYDEEKKQSACRRTSLKLVKKKLMSKAKESKKML